jgi:outer membrane protein assembly factor BamB
MPSTSRRTILKTLAVGSAVGLAGCTSSCPDTDRPDASHIVEPASGSGFETLPEGTWWSPRFNAKNTGYTSVDPLGDTPSVQWKTTVPDSTQKRERRLVSAPVVANDTVVLATRESVLGLSLRDGTERWRRDLTPVTHSSAVSSTEELVCPVVVDETVICVTVGGITALDITDGSDIWRTPSVSGSGTPTRTPEGVVVPTTDGLRMFDVRDGSERWTVPHEATQSAVADGTVVAAGDRTVALDAATGEPQWKVKTESDGVPVVTDATVYLATGDSVVARALSDGSAQWRLDRGRMLQPPVVTPDSLYAVESPGEAGDATFAFDRGGDGKPAPRWCSQVRDGAVTAASDERLLTIQSNGLVAFTAEYGEATWRYPLDLSPQPPAVLDGGLITVLTDGSVVAIGGA